MSKSCIIKSHIEQNGTFENFNKSQIFHKNLHFSLILRHHSNVIMFNNYLSVFF